MHTTLYRLDTTGYQHEFAHLYEHLILQGFSDYATHAGHHPGLIGWLNGDTFAECIYLYVGFYDAAVIDLFHSYLAHLPPFSASEVEWGLGIISAEERSTQTPANQAELTAALRAITRLPWTHGEAGPVVPPAPTAYMRLLQVQKQATKYRDITIDLYAGDLSETEAKVFQRLYVMLCDVITTALKAHYPAYLRDFSTLNSYGEGLEVIGIFTVPRGIATVKGYEQTAYEALTNLDLDKYYPAIKQHMDVYAKEPWLVDIAVEYYRHAHLITTPAEIARLATRRTVSSLMNKLQIYVHATDDADRKIVK